MSNINPNEPISFEDMFDDSFADNSQADKENNEDMFADAPAQTPMFDDYNPSNDENKTTNDTQDGVSFDDFFGMPDSTPQQIAESQEYQEPEQQLYTNPQYEPQSFDDPELTSVPPQPLPDSESGSIFDMFGFGFDEPAQTAAEPPTLDAPVIEPKTPPVDFGTFAPISNASQPQETSNPTPNPEIPSQQDEAPVYDPFGFNTPPAQPSVEEKPVTQSTQQIEEESPAGFDAFGFGFGINPESQESAPPIHGEEQPVDTQNYTEPEPQVYEQPAYQQYQPPVYEQPVYEQPTYEQPTYVQPEPAPVQYEQQASQQESPVYAPEEPIQTAPVSPPQYMPAPQPKYQESPLYQEPQQQETGSTYKEVKMSPVYGDDKQGLYTEFSQGMKTREDGRRDMSMMPTYSEIEPEQKVQQESHAPLQDTQERPAYNQMPSAPEYQPEPNVQIPQYQPAPRPAEPIQESVVPQPASQNIPDPPAPGMVWNPKSEEYEYPEEIQLPTNNPAEKENTEEASKKKGIFGGKKEKKEAMPKEPKPKKEKPNKEPKPPKEKPVKEPKQKKEKPVKEPKAPKEPKPPKEKAPKQSKKAQTPKLNKGENPDYFDGARRFVRYNKAGNSQFYSAKAPSIASNVLIAILIPIICVIIAFAGNFIVRLQLNNFIYYGGPIKDNYVKTIYMEDQINVAQDSERFIEYITEFQNNTGITIHLLTGREAHENMNQSDMDLTAQKNYEMRFKDGCHWLFYYYETTEGYNTTDQGVGLYCGINTYNVIMKTDIEKAHQEIIQKVKNGMSIDTAIIDTLSNIPIVTFPQYRDAEGNFADISLIELESLVIFGICGLIGLLGMIIPLAGISKKKAIEIALDAQPDVCEKCGKEFFRVDSVVMTACPCCKKPFNKEYIAQRKAELAEKKRVETEQKKAVKANKPVNTNAPMSPEEIETANQIAKENEINERKQRQSKFLKKAMAKGKYKDEEEYYHNEGFK